MAQLNPAQFQAPGIRYSTDVVDIVKDQYGHNSETVLQELGMPVRTYYVRCNTTKIHPDSLKRKLEKIGFTVRQHELIPEALGLPIAGPFEIPIFPVKVTLDKQAAEAALQGAHVYAPGIIDPGPMRAGDRVTAVSEFGDPIVSGIAVMGSGDVLNLRRGLAVHVVHRRFVGPQVRELEEFCDGLLYPQSLAAIATSRVLDPKPDETVIDMNCAPGGKLSHISALMRNRGQALGFDRNGGKLNQARETVRRLGCVNVALAIGDSRYLAEDFPALEADRVLIDPPCSALGIRPKIYDFSSRHKIESLASYQKQFLESASKVVRPGGTVVYSVCTFSKQECELIADYAVSECGLRLVAQEPFISSRGIGENGELCQRFHPVKHEIGYFIAKFVRPN